MIFLCLLSKYHINLLCIQLLYLSVSFSLVGNVFPERCSVDRLADVFEIYIQPGHEHQHKDPMQSSDLSDPIVDLDIYALPVQVCAWILLQQRPNHFFLDIELNISGTAADTDTGNYFDKEYYDKDTDIPNATSPIVLEPSTLLLSMVV